MTILDEADNRRNQPTRTLLIAAAVASTIIYIGLAVLSLNALLVMFGILAAAVATAAGICVYRGRR